MFYYTDDDNYYKVDFDVALNRIYLDKRLSAVDSNIGGFDLAAISEALFPSVWYGVRVHVENISGTETRIRVYWDNEEVIDTIDGTSPHTAGSIGVVHSSGAELRLSETEVFQLPLEGDLIDIQS